MLRFMDETIIMEEGCSDNVWIMKAILRGFDMKFFRIMFFCMLLAFAAGAAERISARR